MTDSYQLTLGVWTGVFAVPNAVADKLRLARGDTLKPLLYLLRYGGRAVAPSEIADHTGMTEAAVRDALLFWEQEGVLVHAVGAPAPAAAVPPAPPAPPLPAEDAAVPCLAPAAAEPTVRPLAGAANARVVSSRPARLTAGEINTRCGSDASLRFLLGESERMLGRPLSSSDLSSVVSLVDWAGLPPDIVLMLLEYCREMGKTNLRYIERVGADWADNGVDTHEKAAAYIESRQTATAREREITSAFGLDRALTPKEHALITQWYADFGYDIRMIRLAYERTVDRTGKLSFAYLHSILRAWNEKGYREPKDAAAEPSPAKPAASPSGSSLDLDLAAQQLFRAE